uniref:FTH domain-containing protein n=1 Tax=Panagrellus redivivus TaxID=6233 RepID=A0A7E4V8A1_PANRE
MASSDPDPVQLPDPHQLPDVLKSMFTKNNFDSLESKLSSDKSLLEVFGKYVGRYVNADFHWGELEFFESASTTLKANTDAIKTLFATYVQSLNTDGTILEDKSPFAAALRQNRTITQLIIDDARAKLSPLITNFPNVSYLECSVNSFADLLNASPNVINQLKELSLTGETKQTSKLLADPSLALPERVKIDIDDEEFAFFKENFTPLAGKFPAVKRLNISLRQKSVFFTDEVAELATFLKIFPNLEDARILVDVCAPLSGVNTEEFQTFQNTIKEFEFGVNLNFSLHNEFSAAAYDVGTIDSLKNAGFTQDRGTGGSFTCKWTAPGKSFIHEMENFQAR